MSNLQNQPIINIGCLGSVSDGKSSMVSTFTGINTQKHSSEKIRNITVKQGYGNMKVWQHDDKYFTTNSQQTEYLHDGIEYELKNHISFVDCPGHQELIGVMLSSIALMDGVIIVISVDKAPHEKPQLLQHLAAVVLGKFDKIIICLNKIDLVTKDVVLQRKEELDIMLEQYGICPFAVIPTCFNKKIGLNYLTKAIMELFNPSEFENKKSTIPYFHISRSFDINKPGTNWANLKGGVIGGSLSSGKFAKNDVIEIRPGILVGKTPKISCKPIHTNISTIKTDTTEIDEVQPGGLVGIGTDIDPLYCKDNYLTGNIAGLVGTLPSVFMEITVDINKVELFGFTWDPKVKDQVEIQIGTHMANSVSVQKIKKKTITFLFVSPVCIPDNQHIVICRTINGILKIVAEGYIQYKSNPKPLLV